MPNIKINSDWLSFDLDLKKSVYMSVDSVTLNKQYDINILYLPEPSGVSRIDANQIIKNNKKWDYILTWSNKLLHLPNAILFEWGTTWVGPSHKDINKTNLCSMICGDKSWMPGHLKRKKIFNEILPNSTVNKFYSKNSSWKKYKHNPNMLELDVDGNDRLDAFKSNFHIAIENCSENYYFTEKLIDCFLTKTIPLYWGAPNIGDYFNKDGIILIDNFSNIKDLLGYIKNVDIKQYQYAIEENYNKSLYWIDLKDRLKNKLIELVG